MNPALVSLLLGLFELLGRSIPSVLDAMHRTGELTDAEWAEAKARYERTYQEDHWQPEVP